MKPITKLIALSTVVLVAFVSYKLAFPSSPLPGKESDVTNDSISLITGPFGTGSYMLGNALEQIVNKYGSEITLNSTESPGQVYNIRNLGARQHLKKDTFIASSTALDYLATLGRKPFRKKHASTQLIANYNLGSVWLATFNSEIRSVKDLVGKRVALGRRPQIIWTIEPEMIIRDGWGLRDQIDIQYLGTKQASQALLNGTVDAAVIGGYADPIKGDFQPSPQTLELFAAGKPLYHIPWGEDAIQKVMDQGIPIKHLTISAGSISGLDKDFNSFFDAIAWVAYPELDEKHAYQLAKILIERVDEFSRYHALGKLMSRESLIYGWDKQRIHPGALRAYREAGMIPEVQ